LVFRNLLILSIVGFDVCARAQYETRASRAIKYKRWMAAKARRHAKQARWKCKIAAKDQAVPVLDVVVTDSDKEDSDKAKGCNSESSSTPSQASSEVPSQLLEELTL
jgi:hypothetical protein